MANYLREPYSADLDFGTGEWSASAWVNYGNNALNLFDNSTNPGGSGGTSTTVSTVTYDSKPSAVAFSINQAISSARVGRVETSFSIVAGTQYRVGFKAALSRPLVSGETVYIALDGAQYQSNQGTSINNDGAFQQYSFNATGVNSGNGFLYVQSTTVLSPITVYITEVQANMGATLLPYTATLSGAAYAFGLVAGREFSSGASIKLGTNSSNQLTATAYDGTTTRTVTSPVAYNTGTWLKAEACYTTDGTLSIRVNGQQVAATYGAPLGSLNNSNAVLTIGNSYNADAPFPGSLALLKLSATVPTAEQSLWMYEQEKQMFREGAQITLPDSNAIADLAYDEVTDKWIAVTSTNMSEWSGLVRTNVTAVPSGSYSKLASAGGVSLQGRGSNVDISIPAYGLRKELVKRAEAAAKLNAHLVPYDYVGGFTATTTTGATSITSVAGLSYPVSCVGAKITGTGIPTDTFITAVNGTTIYLSKAATATGTAVQISFTDFILPLGYEAKDVLLAGVSQKEGSTAAFTRLFDGFKETIRFAVAPSYTALVQIQAARSIQ